MAKETARLMAKTRQADFWAPDRVSYLTSTGDRDGSPKISFDWNDGEPSQTLEKS